MKTSPLHPRFGVEIAGVDLREVTATCHYPEIRALFEQHSLLLFRDQHLDEAAQNDLALLFGPLEDRLADTARTPPRARPSIPRLSNREDGALLPADSLDVLNLIANQQWHTASTFLNTPALINLITAHVVPSRGGETELVSTRAAFVDLPADLRARVADAVFLHSVLPSRLRVDPDLLALEQVARYGCQAWQALWPNPVTGLPALYIAGHVYGVRGMAPAEAEAFVAELLTFCTRPKYVYSHAWRSGDVLIWDERATMHRGRPWPLNEERTLTSCCVSARDLDGLTKVRPPDGPARAEEAFVPPA